MSRVSRFLLASVSLPLLLAARPAHAQATMRRAAVATRNIARGTVLTADDFTMRDTTLRAPLDTNRVAAGWVTRRMINAGEVLVAPAVEPPTIVNANAPVQLEYNDQGVRLTVRGTATKNAAMGERVVVRTELGNRIEGTVIAPGKVRID
jgi:flagella basal body P-ring formation protein FlgA